MIVVLKQNLTKEETAEVKRWLQAMEVQVQPVEGMHTTVFALVGDTSRLDKERLSCHPFVESVQRIQAPYKNADRVQHPKDTLVQAGGFSFGGGHFQVIAGPCSVECESQIKEVASRVKAAGATLLRGGAFKPRTSPYSFQGLGADGLDLLMEAKHAIGMPIVTEIMSAEHLPLFQDVDIIQVGARNMQNFDLLKKLGKTDKPILLKRGLANTIDELLMSAEYIMAGGNPNVILCERGIRTFETATRNTLDISAIPILKHRTHLPVVVDPSHASGISWMVEPLSKAAVAAGADGLIIEVHNDPQKALSDGAQSLTPDEFDRVMESVRKLVQVEGKILG